MRDGTIKWVLEVDSDKGIANLRDFDRQKKTLVKNTKSDANAFKRAWNDAFRDFDRKLDRSTDLVRDWSVASRALQTTSMIFAISGLTGAFLALIPTLVNVIGLIYAVPAALMSVGAIAGTITAGFGGMGEAMKQMGKAASGGAGAVKALRKQLAGFDEMNTLEDQDFGAGGAGGVDALADAMNKLSPAAQELVKAFAEIGDAFIENIRKPLQEEMFKDLAGQVLAAYYTIEPALKGAMLSIGTAMNVLFLEMTRVAQTPMFSQLITDVGVLSTEMLVRLRPAISDTLTIMFNLFQIGSPYVIRFTDWVVKLIDQFADFTSSFKGKNLMKAWIDNGIDAMKDLGKLTKSSFGLIADLFTAASKSGISFVDVITNTIERFRDWLRTAQGMDFINNLVHTAATLWESWVGVLSVFGRLIGSILEHFNNLPGPLQSIISSFLAWAVAINPIVLYLGQFASLFAGITGAVKIMFVAIGAMAPIQNLGAAIGLFATTAVTNFGSVGTAAKIMGTAFMSALGPIGLILAAVTAIVGIGFAIWSSTQETQAQKARDDAEKLRKKQEELEEKYQDSVEAVKNFYSTLETQSSAMGRYSTYQQEQITAQEQYNEAVRNFGPESVQARDAMFKLNDANIRLKSSGEAVKDAIGDTTDTIKKMSSSVAASTKEGQALVDSLKITAEQVKSVTGAEDERYKQAYANYETAKKSYEGGQALRDVFSKAVEQAAVSGYQGGTKFMEGYVSKLDPNNPTLLTNVQNVTATVSTLLSSNNEKVAAAGSSTMTAYVTALDQGKPNVAANIRTMLEQMNGMLNSNNPQVQALGTAAMKAYTDAINNGQPQVATSIRAVMGGLNESLSSNDPNVKASGERAMSTYVAALNSKDPNVRSSATSLAASLATGLSSKDPEVRSVAQNTMQLALKAIQDKNPQVRAAGEDAINKLKMGISNEGEWRQINNNLSSKMQNAADQTNAGFTSRINSPANRSSLWGSLSIWAGNVASAVKSSLGIHSPSRVFAEIGEFSVMGFAKGIDDNVGIAEKSMSNFADTISAYGPGLDSQFGANSNINASVEHSIASRENDTQPVALTVKIGEDEVATKIIELVNERSSMSGYNQILV